MHQLCSQVILRNAEGHYLLQMRKRGPNMGNWALAGGKLEPELMESPAGCAIREVAEETGISIELERLTLRCLLHEINFTEDGSQWTIFYYEYLAPFNTLPPPMEEGHFAFFSKEELPDLPMLRIDRELILRNNGALAGASFVSAEVDCKGGFDGELNIHEIRHESLQTRAGIGGA